MSIIWFQRIEINNFESHKNTVIDLDPGINVLIGESDCGKSGILRAIAWLCYNNASGVSINDSMRIDQEASSSKGKEFECSVRVTLSNGTTVERIRGKTASNNKYVLQVPGEEEQVFTNFKQGVPIEIEQALGFGVYTLAGKSRALVNYMSQHDLPMSMSVSGSELSQMLNLANNLDVFDEAHQRIRSKTQGNGEISQAIRLTRNRIEQQEMELLEIEDPAQDIAKVEDIIARIDALKERESKIILAQSLLQKHHGATTRLDQVREELDKNKKIAQFESKIQEHSVYVNHSVSAFNLITRHMGICKRIAKLQKELGRLQHIVKLPIGDISAKAAKAEKAAKLVIAYSRLTKNIQEKRESRADILATVEQLNAEMAEISRQRIDLIARECKVCPMCQVATSDESREHIKDYLEREGG